MNSLIRTNHLDDTQYVKLNSLGHILMPQFDVWTLRHIIDAEA